jgi:hypothetical protein
VLRSRPEVSLLTPSWHSRYRWSRCFMAPTRSAAYCMNAFASSPGSLSFRNASGLNLRNGRSSASRFHSSPSPVRPPAHVHGVAAGRRDTADLERRRGDEPQQVVRCTAVHSQGLAPASVTVSRPACSPTLKGCNGRPVNGRYRGGRPGAGRIGGMAVSPRRRGPDQRAGTASTAAATAYAARS